MLEQVQSLLSENLKEMFQKFVSNHTIISENIILPAITVDMTIIADASRTLTQYPGIGLPF